MGTSKSYITPKTAQNSSVKRGITNNLRGGRVSIPEVVARFATAVKTENLSVGNSSNSFKHYGQQISGVLGFISNAASFGGILNAINQKYPQNPPRTPQEFFSRLLEEDSNMGTLDNAVVVIALSLSIKKLEIVDLQQLDEFDFSIFTKELLANLVMTCFEQRYTVQIQSKAASLSQAGNKLNEFKEYIYNDIIANTETDDINQYIQSNNILATYVETKCAEVFSHLENYI